MTSPSLARFSLLCLLWASMLAAQAPSPRIHANAFTFDVTWLGGGIGYARRRASGRFVGGEIGILQDALAATFMHRGRYAQWRPQATTLDSTLIEILHASAFVRMAPLRRVTVDAGLRVSVALVDEDPQGDDLRTVSFAGLYISPMFGSRRLKVGSRIQAGAYRFENANTQAYLGTHFGVAIAPLTVRFTLP